jgi:hypothetical protein
MRKEDFVKDNYYVVTKDTNFLTMANGKQVLVRQNEKILFSHYQDYANKHYSTLREARDSTVSLVFLRHDVPITPQYDCRNIAAPTAEAVVLDPSNLRMERAKALRRRIAQAETNMKSIVDLIEAKMNERDALRTWIDKAQTQASNLENFPDDATAMADMLNKIRGTNELTEQKLKEIVASFALV